MKNMIAEKLQTPVLKYWGSKYSIAPWITSQFPEHRTYIDLFGGSASVILQKKPAKHEIYNDIDGEVVNFFRVLREDGSRLIKLIDRTPYSREEFELSLLPSEDLVEQARRTFIKMNAGIKFNLGGSFRPYGNAKCSGGYIAAKNFQKKKALVYAKKRLKDVTIENTDYKKLLNGFINQPDCLIFIDPPYLGSTRGKAKIYKNEMMSALSHARLLKQIRNSCAMIIISGYDHPLYDKFLPGWNKEYFKTTNNKQDERIEVTWSNVRREDDLFAA